MSRLPPGFWWGTTSSSTQAEGAAASSDWSAREAAGLAPPSGRGNDFSRRADEDFALEVAHGLTHHRLTLDWARLEPRPGQHDHGAVEHYRDVLVAARDAGTQVWAGLHHFTLPGWFSEDARGFLDYKSRGSLWPRHVDWVAETFGDLVAGWVPVNEPVSYALGTWRGGGSPATDREAELQARLVQATLRAEYAAWRLLRSGASPVACVHTLGPVQAGFRDDDPSHRDAARRSAAGLEAMMWSGIRSLRHGVIAVPGLPDLEIPDLAGAFDVVGVRFAGSVTVEADGSTGPYPQGERVAADGVAPWPEGLGLVLRRLAEEVPDHPLFVAEAGVTTPDDDWRAELVDGWVHEVDQAIHDGIDLRGFFHGSGVDHYDWTLGLEVPTGMFDLGRHPRPSAAVAHDRATRPAAG